MSGPAQTIRVEVVYALPERAWRVARILPGDATVAMAVAAAMAELQAAGLPITEASVSGSPMSALQLAIYGRAVEPHTPLQDGDRVELLRPLLADPKQARRQRAREKPVREQAVREQSVREQAARDQPDR